MNGDLNAAMNEGVRTGLMLAEVFSNVIALNIMRKSFEVKDLKLLNGTPLLPPLSLPPTSTLWGRKSVNNAKYECGRKRKKLE